MGLLAIVLLVALAACTYQAAYPTKGIRDFVTSDPKLATAMLNAAKEWADAGVVEAAYVTVNVNKNGLPIKWCKPSELNKLCNTKGGNHGCTSYTDDGQFEALYIADNITDKRLREVMMHELIHVLLNIREHTPEKGIFNKDGNSDDITMADLNWICRQADCIDPHPPSPKVQGMKA